jgi:hypothetical protein
VKEVLHMTEAEWLSCEEPDKMLTYLERRRKVNRPSERKRRLFFIACCRRLLIAPISGPERLERLLRSCEEFAEGFIGAEELRAAASPVLFQCLGTSDDNVTVMRAIWAGIEAASGRFIRPEPAELPLGHGVIWRRHGEWMTPSTEEQQARCALLRDIFGNPFRVVSIAPSVRMWAGGVAVHLAEGVYDVRAFDRLPILADALEEAGSTDADLLNHCRQPGEHVRGCWVVDLIRGAS